MVEQRKVAKEYLEIAKMDLCAAKLLYDAGKFNIAVFELQQAVEKVTKCFILVMEDNKEPFFKIEELRNHNSLNFLIQIIERYIKLIDEKYDKKDAFADNIKNGIKDILNEQKKRIKDINGKEDKEEINNQLVLLNKFKDFNVTNISKDHMVLILKNNYNITLSKKDIDKRYNELKNNINKVDFLKLLNKIFLPLSLLGAITFRHEQSTRYPFEVENKNIVIKITPKEYKNGLGIVDTFPQMEELLKSVIVKIEEEFPIK